MQVERQGNFECLLATIAALTDTRLKRVRNIALHWGKVRQWSDMAGHPEFWPTIKHVLRRLDREEWWPYMQHYMPVGEHVNREVAEDIPVDSVDFPDGRGMVTVRQPLAKHGHAMPWENGLAFDPQTGLPHTLACLRVMGFDIVRIVRFNG
jgi:hypothetical protein